MAETILEKIYRFPVKGFPGQEVSQTSLEAGAGIPHDRQFAITNGTQDTGEWMKARSFFINAVIDGMSKFKMSFDGDTITLRNIQGIEISFRLGDMDSLKAANQKIPEFMQPVSVQGNLPVPQIIERKGKKANWDYVDTPISIINTESVKAIDDVMNTNLDPLRFRGNLVISGLSAWEEFSWMGKRIQIGNIIMDVHRPIDRCPTPGVNPETGERDVEVTPGIRDHFGHIYCGMYANIVQSGNIKPGDKITVIGDAEIKLEDVMVSNASNYALWPRMAEVSACSIGEKSTTITLKNTCPWPLPQAQKGQRLKLHLGHKGWTQEYITDVAAQHFHLEIEDSQTDDPITKHLQKDLAIGEKILISGPYGRI